MRRRYVGLVTLLVTLALSALSIYGTGNYGWSLFLLVPFYVGFLPTALLAIGRARTFLSWPCRSPCRW
jgi:hypothetical protein